MTDQENTQTQQSQHTVNFSSIMLGTSQPGALAKFYENVFGRPADMSEGSWYMWQGSCALSIGEHSEVTGQAKEPSRIILNLETKHVKEEFDRIKALGATVVKDPYEMGGGWIATLADPDGNFVQLVTPWEMPS